MRGDAVLGIDIGGTSITADVVSLDGTLLHSSRCPTGSGDTALNRLMKLAEDAVDAATSLDVALCGIGVLTPGHVDEEKGIVRFASNLDWNELDLTQHLRSIPALAPLPSAVGHDVRWAGIAEGVFGAARGSRDYAVLSIGTGIAACIVVDGQVLSGTTGSAGEIGHATVVPGGEQCACGRIGCLDAYASGAALLRRYRAQGGSPIIGSAEHLLAAREHDAVARTVWDEAIDALAAGLTTLVMTTDPAMITLVGGVSQAGDALTSPLRRRLAGSLQWKKMPSVMASPLQALSGRAGAVLRGLHRAGREGCAQGWSADTVEAWKAAT